MSTTHLLSNTTEHPDINAALASGDLFFVYDLTTKQTHQSAISRIATYINANPGTFTGAILAGDTSYTATASFSFVIGSTLTSRIGFYGKAGTSQPASANQAALTITAVNPTTCTGVVGFATTAAFADFVNQSNEMRNCLVNNGLMKGAS